MWSVTKYKLCELSLSFQRVKKKKHKKSVHAEITSNHCICVIVVQCIFFVFFIRFLYAKNAFQESGFKQHWIFFGKAGSPREGLENKTNDKTQFFIIPFSIFKAINIDIFVNLSHVYSCSFSRLLMVFLRKKAYFSFRRRPSRTNL